VERFLTQKSEVIVLPREAALVSTLRDLGLMVQDFLHDLLAAIASAGLLDEILLLAGWLETDLGSHGGLGIRVSLFVEPILALHGELTEVGVIHRLLQLHAVENGIKVLRRSCRHGQQQEKKYHLWVLTHHGVPSGP